MYMYMLHAVCLLLLIRFTVLCLTLPMLPISSMIFTFFQRAVLPLPTDKYDHDTIRAFASINLYCPSSSRSPLLT